MHTAFLLIFVSIIATVVPSKILYLDPRNTTSHHIWNTVLVNALAKRGHQLTYITGQSFREEPHHNVKYAVYQQSEREQEAWGRVVHESYFGSPMKKARVVGEALLADCEEMFKSGPYKDLIDPKNTDSYDVIIMEYTGHDCLLPLSLRFGSPPVILTMSVTHNPHWVYRIARVPIFPLVPHIIDDKPELSGIWDRLQSTFLYLRNDFDYFTFLIPTMEKINQKYFGQDVIPITQLFDNVALSLVNIPDFMNKIPLTPNVIPIGGMHLEEPKPLPTDLKKIMDEAKNGVIFISFGTYIPTGSLDMSTFRSMAAALSRLPQKVLWKWDPNMADDNITFSDNILRLSWFPQSDVLGHPNMRVFVSHCGGQSILESMFHGVPILAVPGFFDQNGNADRLAAEGAAIRLNFNEINENSFLKTLQELLENPKFSEGALRLKNSLRDQPTKPLERAVFWVEYVIRHKGAPHLRSLLANLPHNHVLITDIVVATIVSMITLAVLLKSLVFLLRLVRNSFSKNPKWKSD